MLIFFKIFLKKCNKKINKIWVYKCSEFYFLEIGLLKNCYSEGKYVVAKKLMKTLTNKTYKCMTSISQNVYIDKLDDTVNEYNNTYRRIIKMKPVDVKDNIYILTLIK